MVAASALSLNAVLETSLDAVVVMEETGLVAGWNKNAERLFGYTQAEAMHRSVAELIIPPDQHAAHYDGIKRYLDLGEVHILGKRSKFTAMHRDGHQLPVELAVTVYSNISNRCFIGFIRDLTAQTAAAAKIESLNAEVLQLSRLNAMGTAASMIAHELNQPLSAAVNYLSACRNMISKTEAIELDQLALGLIRAQKAIFRASAVIKVVREIVAKRPSLPSNVGLSSLFKDTVRLLETSLPVQPVIQFGPDANRVLANKGQIQQVILNLLKNAIEAIDGRSDPQLICSSRRDGETVEICIQDNGPGLPVGVSKSLFVPFHSDKKGGLGIGLSICRTIVEEHGGRLWATSGHTGTAFRFTLPAG